MFKTTEKDIESGLPKGASNITTENGKESGTSVPNAGEEELSISNPSLAKVLGMAKPEIPMMIVAFIFLVVGEAANLIIPIILASAYDELIVNLDNINQGTDVMPGVNRIMAWVVGIYFGGAVLGFFRTTIQGVIGERLVARLRCKLYASILKQEIAFFDQHKSGELVSRLGSDTTLLQNSISFSIPEVIVGVIKSITALVLMFLLSAKLAGASFGGVAFIFLLCLPLGKALGKLSKDYQDVLGEAQTHSTEAFGSMRTVQSFAAEMKETQRFDGKIGNPDHYTLWWPFHHKKDGKTTYSVGFFKSLVNSGFFTLIFGGGFGFLYVSLWYGFYLVSKGELTIGQLTAFQSYVFNIGFGLGQVGGNATKVFEALGASGRIFYLVERIPKIPKQPDDEKKTNKPIPALKPVSIQGDIEFKNVNFSYPTRPGVNVLDDFNLKIPSGTTTGKLSSSDTHPKLQLPCNLSMYS